MESPRKNDALEILNFLNFKAEKMFEPDHENLKCILDRLREGATVEVCRQVIVKKSTQWKEDREMNSNLNPIHYLKKIILQDIKVSLSRPVREYPTMSDNICPECKKIYDKNPTRCGCGWYMTNEKILNLNKHTCYFIKLGKRCEEISTVAVSPRDNEWYCGPQKASKQVNDKYKQKIESADMFHTELYLAVMTKQPEGLINKTYSILSQFSQKLDKALKQAYLSKRHRELNDVTRPEV